MTRTCALTGRKAQFGRSYTLRGIAKKKKGIGLKVTGCTNRRFLPNLKTKRIWIPEEKRFVTLSLSTAALRTIDKKGVNAVIHKLRKSNQRAKAGRRI
jgi:large subunit ribosomal protein L28